MKHPSQNAPRWIKFPFSAAMAIVFIMIIVLFSYLYCNYAAAASLRTEPYTEITHSRSVSEAYAKVILYRVDDDNSPASRKVVSIFINKQYFTSILPRNRAVELILCPGAIALDISVGQLDKRRFGQSENISATSLTLQAGKRYFSQIVLNKPDKMTAQWVSASEADRAPFSLNPQLLTLSAVAPQHCQP